MQRDPKAYLADVHKAATLIQEFARGRNELELQQNEMLRSAIYYQFAIIGEALVQLKGVDEKMVDRISESWRIIGFRNQVIHGYHAIHDAITWRIIEEKVPILIAEVDGLIK